MKAPAILRLSLLVASSLATGLSSLPAHAAPDARPSATTSTGATGVAQLNEEGAALYAARDYRRAIEKFIQAYAIDNDPNLLFNIARCYEELGEVDAAIEKYEAFLKTPGADARGRQRARESLSALRASKESAAASSTPAPTTQEPAASSEPRANQPVAEAEEDSSLPWWVLGGSIAFAAAGTTFYLLGASDHGKVTDAEGFGDPNAVSPMTRREADELVSSGDTKKLIGGIGFGVAGALAATYVALLLTDGDEATEQAEPSLGWSVLPARRGAAFSLQGSF